MLFRFTNLASHAHLFQSCTGLRPAEFMDLACELRPILEAARKSKLTRPGRKREIGAGPHHQLTLTDQLLLTVVWLRLYPTNEVLGYLFGVSDSTASRVISFVLPYLEASGRASFRRQDPGRKHRLSLAELVSTLPELDVLVDSFEQKVQRPRDYATQKEYYSGKKKCHTLKSQIAVCASSGRIVDIGPSVVGPTPDLKLLAQSALLSRLAPGTAVGGDLGYLGLKQLYTTGPVYLPFRKPRGKEQPEEDKQLNTAFARVRIVVEHSIGRMRRYSALMQTDRHHRTKHQGRTVAVAGLANRQLEWRWVA